MKHYRYFYVTGYKGRLIELMKALDNADVTYSYRPSEQVIRLTAREHDHDMVRELCELYYVRLIPDWNYKKYGLSPRPK